MSVLCVFTVRSHKGYILNNTGLNNIFSKYFAAITILPRSYTRGSKVYPYYFHIIFSTYSMPSEIILFHFVQIFDNSSFISIFQLLYPFLSVLFYVIMLIVIEKPLLEYCLLIEIEAIFHSHNRSHTPKQ